MPDTRWTDYAFAVPGSTTTRTYPARAVDVINVKDFNAKGDGHTDDTSAIQAAINFALSAFVGRGSRYGAIVYLPAGTYIVSQYIDLSPVELSAGGALCFVGAGRDATIIKGNVFNGAAPDGNPPFGMTEWGNGTMGTHGGVTTSTFLAPSAVVTGTWSSNNLAEVRDMTFWNTSTAKWAFAAVFGCFQTETIFSNLRFKGKNGVTFNESYGIVTLNCIAESTTAHITADRVPGGDPTPTFQLASDLPTFNYPPVLNIYGYNRSVNVHCPGGTIGMSLPQGSHSGHEVIGPFDNGLGLCWLSSTMQSCRVSRCTVGLSEGMGAGGLGLEYVQCGGSSTGGILSNIFDRCIVGMINRCSSKTVAANIITGVQGPCDLAQIDTLSYNASNHVVTVTCHATHKLPGNTQLYLSVPSDWLPIGSDGVVAVTVTVGGNQFTYAGPLATPSSSGTSPGMGWNFVPQHAIRMDLDSQYCRFAGNHLPAHCTIASVSYSAGCGSKFMATLGPYGWKYVEPGGSTLFMQAGWDFVMCGFSDDRLTPLNNDNPLIPSLRMRDLPAANETNMLEIYPVQNICPGQEYWIIDGASANVGDIVGTPLTPTASVTAGPGPKTLTFASVPAQVANGDEIRDKYSPSSHIPEGATVDSHTGTTITVNAGLYGNIDLSDTIWVLKSKGTATWQVRYDGAHYLRVA